VEFGEKMSTTIDRQNIELAEIENDSDELSEHIHYSCCFCGKQVEMLPMIRKLCERLSGQRIYCPFCLRNNMHTKSNKHVLIMSYRSVFGYYYYTKYLGAGKRNLWLTEISDIIDSHWDAGVQNPVFLYDPDSFLWFIDFSKVGKGRKRIRTNEVLKTILNQILCLNLPHHITTMKMGKFYHKFETAIKKFSEERYRPTDKRFLIPTLKDCGGYESQKKFTFDVSREFTPDHMFG